MTSSAISTEPNPEQPIARRDAIDPGTEYVAPNGPTEQRLAQLWQAALRIDRVGRHDSFFELGGDSMQAIDLVLRIEKELAVVLPPSTIIDHPTLGELAPLVSGGKQENPASRCIVPLQEEGANPPLFLLHELGGNLFCYRELVQRLGAGRRIFGIMHPGQEQDPIPAFSIPELAEIYVGGIKHVQPDGPYLLAGFSFGGSVAYEIACRLRQRGDRVALVALLDAPNRDGLVRGAQRKALKLSQHLAALSEEKTSAWPDYLMREIRKGLSRGKAAPPVHAIEPPAPGALPPKLLHLMYGTLMRAHAEYDPPVFDGEVKLFRTNAGGSRWSRRHYGWRVRALGGVDVIDIHGDHGSVLGAPNVGLVAEYLSLWIERALREAVRPPGAA